MANKLGNEPNVTVFLILDCCRTFIDMKGPKYDAEPLSGQLFIGYGAKKGFMATALGNSSSKYTTDLLNKLMENSEITLPRDILQWKILSTYAD